MHALVSSYSKIVLLAPLQECNYKLFMCDRICENLIFSRAQIVPYSIFGGTQYLRSSTCSQNLGA